MHKYAKELVYRDVSPININLMVDTTYNIWKQLDSPHVDTVLRHYSLYLAEATWLLRQALEQKDMGQFVKSTNL